MTKAKNKSRGSLILSGREIEGLDRDRFKHVVRLAGTGPSPDECPYGAVGDRLWVQERFSLLRRWRTETDGVEIEYVRFAVNTTQGDNFAFMLDGKRTTMDQLGLTQEQIDDMLAWKVNFNRSNNLERWASRLTVNLASVHLCKLHDLWAPQLRQLGFGENDDSGEAVLRDFIGYWDLGTRQGYRWVSNPNVWIIALDPIWSNIDNL